jgi:hypothetical protein
MAKTVFAVLCEKLDADISSASDFLVSGGAKDLAAYKETCGLLRGLRIAREYVTDLEKKIINGDDDD